MKMTDNVVYSRGGNITEKNKQTKKPTVDVLNPGCVCVKASTGAAMKMMFYKK